MSWLPVMPIPGSGQAAFQPIWAEDVADCVLAALPGRPADADSVGARYELAGPETLTHQQIVEIALGSFHRERRILKVPVRVTRRLLELVELLGGRPLSPPGTRPSCSRFHSSPSAEWPMRSGSGSSPGRCAPYSAWDEALGIARTCGLHDQGYWRGD